MSMRDYAVDDYGLVLDKEAMKAMISKLGIMVIDEEDFDFSYYLYDEGICEYISEFTGEAQAINDDGYFDFSRDYESYNSDSIAYVPLAKYPTLFKRAYNNMEEIIDELKLKIGKYVPEDFDYRSRICHICGTYFG